MGRRRIGAGIKKLRNRPLICLILEHRTRAEVEAEVLVFEPRATRNTGNIVDEKFTAPNDARI